MLGANVNTFNVDAKYSLQKVLYLTQKGLILQRIATEIANLSKGFSQSARRDVARRPRSLEVKPARDGVNVQDFAGKVKT